VPDLADVRSRVRVGLQDLRNLDAPRNTIEVDNAICEAYMVLAADLPPPHLLSTGGVTLSANSSTFTLPIASNQIYGGDVRIRRQSDGIFLYRLTVEEIDARRSGHIQTTGMGKPDYFALWEDSSQVVQGRCWPIPSANEVCDLFANLVPDDLRNAATLETAGIVQFSRWGLEALVLRARANLLTAMTAEDAEARHLDKSVAPLWLADSQRLLMREAARRHDLESVGRIMRNVR
jgi:hypothetical protein